MQTGLGRCVIDRLAKVVLAVLLAASLPSVARAEKLHFTYLWHMEQPIYWPDRQASGADRYERAWESIQRKDAGAAHPENNLREIFSVPDRVAAYQHRVRDAIDLIRGYPDAGAQVSYSGGLIENIQSLGNANQLGYSPTWYNPLRQARGWTTTGGGKSRCDIVIFPFHHPLLPLLDDSAIRKELQLYQAVYAEAWGGSPPPSKGLFPPEMAFSTRLIPLLAEAGVQWVFVSGEKLSRACSDFPVVLGTGGINCDPPNRADRINPPQTDYYRVSISRGCSPAEAYPFAFQPHRARYVNPQTGSISQIIVVPCAQALGWQDGFGPMGLNYFNDLQTLNNPLRPMLVVLAHDGDNFWGGGYSYYMEATPNLVASAQAAGYTANVVERYLQSYPVPAGDFVHVEDGAWVNADGDFGSPMMLNWNWPLVNASGQIDVENGWHVDARNWAVITAAQNRVDTAEQIAGGVNINRILHPSPTTTPAERAWHYFLGALNSGYMYYGTALDMEVKPTIACNRAVQYADTVIGDASADATPPTVWIPQRHPWNPGSLNFGPQYGYKQYHCDGDFWIWTFVYDVSGVESVTLNYRVDLDGVNPLDSIQNETYAGGPEVGPWQSLPMTRRVFPAGNHFNDPGINFFEMPEYIADQYHVKVTALREVLIDYYVEAVDNKGNVRRSPIQHVYIGDGSGGNGGGGDVVTVEPAPPVAGQSAVVKYNPAGRPLAGASQVRIHHGYNNWSPVVSPDPAMTWNAAESRWQVTLNLPPTAWQLDMVFHNAAGTWDNNSGADWHFAVTGTGPPDWVMDGVLDTGAALLGTNGGLRLWAGLKGDVLYVACDDAGEGNDHFILIARQPGPMRPAMWAKAGQVAAWDAFLADENDNSFSGWFDTTASRQSATGPNGGVLEGTLNLREHYGGQVPTTLYMAFAAYATPDGGMLVHQMQIPLSINNDGNIDAGEYMAVDLCSLTTRREPPDLDQDCDVDQEDFDLFLACRGGPSLPPSPGCPPGVDADFDGDSDVDQDDFARLQRCFSGSGLFAPVGCADP